MRSLQHSSRRDAAPEKAGLVEALIDAVRSAKPPEEPEAEEPEAEEPEE